MKEKRWKQSFNHPISRGRKKRSKEWRGTKGVSKEGERERERKREEKGGHVNQS